MSTTPGAAIVQAVGTTGASAANNPFEQAERQQEARQSDDEQQKSDNRKINNHPNYNV